MFRSNFDDFYGPVYHQSKQSWEPDPYDWVLPPNKPTLFGTHFLSFHIYTAGKCFGQILTTFSGSSTTRVEKVENEARWLGFVPKTYPHFLGSILSVSRQYRCNIFWSNFDGFSRPELHRSSQSWKPSPYDSVLNPKHTHTFSGLGTTRAGPKQAQLKLGPDDSALHPKHTHTICGTVLIVSHQYDWNMFRSNFDDFFRHGHDRSRKSWKRGLDNSALCLKYTHTF